MKKYYSKKPYLEYKSALSFYFQKFLGFDKKLRRNILIGGGLMLIVVFTGFLLALISLIQFGGNLIDEAIGELKETRMIDAEREFPHRSDRNI